MRTAAAVTSLFLLMPLQAKAQNIELTLNCEYESLYDYKKALQEDTSGSFSAIVPMLTLKDGAAVATIQATTLYCFNFEGSFSDLEVYGDCERTLSDSTKVKASLRINRVNGEFDNTLIQGNSIRNFAGHCKPAKKLF